MPDWRALLAVGVFALVGVSSGWAQDGMVSAARGAALFEGREALEASIRDHVTALPGSVVACRNCHGMQVGRGGLPGQAPVLDRQTLTSLMSRRNGPVSAYDPASFCRVVRTGIDARSIMLGRTMPLFAIDPAQCESLWKFLISGGAS